MRRLATGLIVSALLLTAGCGGESDTPTEKPKDGTIADVSVEGAFGEKPSVKFNAPMSFEKSESETLEKGPGDGDEVIATSTVKINYLGLNASDATVFDTTWKDEGEPTPAEFKLSLVFKGLTDGLQGAHAGDRLLLTLSSDDALGDVGNSVQTIRAGDSLIMVVDVLKVTNPTVVPQAELPTLTFDKDDQPEKFVAKPSTPDGVGLLGVYTIKEGDGPAVEAGQELTVEYLGQIWPDGAVFDESYSRKAPAKFSLDSVIPGWTQGLEGQKVGSRVILAIPSDLAYGPTGSTSGSTTIPPNSDLIFVIDILKATTPEKE